MEFIFLFKKKKSFSIFPYNTQVFFFFATLAMLSFTVLLGIWLFL